MVGNDVSTDTIGLSIRHVRSCPGDARQGVELLQWCRSASLRGRILDNLAGEHAEIIGGFVLIAVGAAPLTKMGLGARMRGTHRRRTRPEPQ